MSLARVLSSCAATIVVAGCTVLVVQMARSGDHSSAAPAPQQSAQAPTPTPRPAFIAAPTPTAPPVRARRPAVRVTPTSAPSSSPAITAAVAEANRAAAADPKTAPARSVEPATTHPVPAVPAAPPVARPKPAVKAAPVVATGQRLPLHYTTGKATRVITVVARSTASTTATLQAWTKAAGGGWKHYGSPVTAWVGSDGLSTHPSESRSASPIGSFTLTRAFGRDANPGTKLPYLKTTPADWWISQSGPLYNTRQRCASGCGFRTGDPNEHLYYEVPYYDYAVVIDYNTRNAPGGVRQGAGSAFFLHVHPSGTGPTAGCVSIPMAKLVTLLRWLTPAAHPRILIGVS